MGAQQYKLSPSQIQKLNRMKHMSINPNTFLILTIKGTTAKVTGPALEVSITLAEAFKL